MDIITKKLDKVDLLDKNLDELIWAQPEFSSNSAASRSSYAPQVPPARVNLLTRGASSPSSRDLAYQEPVNNLDLAPSNQGYTPHDNSSAYSFDEYASQTSSAYEDVNSIQGYRRNNLYLEMYNPGWR
jgi:hypothetical protein